MKAAGLGRWRLHQGGLSSKQLNLGGVSRPRESRGRFVSTKRTLKCQVLLVHRLEEASSEFVPGSTPEVKSGFCSPPPESCSSYAH